MSCRSCWLSRAYEKEGLVSKYMSVHKDIFHLEQKFMYSYTFWIVMRFFYIVVYRRRSHRRRWTFVASSWNFINTIYILFSSTSSIFSHSYCSCFLPAFHERTAEIKYRFLYFRNEKKNFLVCCKKILTLSFYSPATHSLSCPKDISKKMRKRAYKTTTTVIF